MLVLFVFCYPVRRVIATVANKQSKQKKKKPTGETQEALFNEKERAASGRGHAAGAVNLAPAKTHHLIARGEAALDVSPFERPSITPRKKLRAGVGGWVWGGRGRYITITINSGAAQPRDLSHQLPVIGAAVSCVL